VYDERQEKRGPGREWRARRLVATAGHLPPQTHDGRQG
jgi:hypothetical protein